MLGHLMVTHPCILLWDVTCWHWPTSWSPWEQISTQKITKRMTVKDRQTSRLRPRQKRRQRLRRRTTLPNMASLHWVWPRIMIRYSTLQELYLQFAFCWVLLWVGFTHILQGYFTGTGAIIRLPQCQWSNPEGNVWLSCESVMNWWNNHDKIKQKKIVFWFNVTYLSWYLRLFLCDTYHYTLKNVGIPIARNDDNNIDFSKKPFLFDLIYITYTCIA